MIYETLLKLITGKDCWWFRFAKHRKTIVVRYTSLAGRCITSENEVDMSCSDLLDAITDQNILNQKIIMDRLPDNYIKSDYNLQTAFFANLTSDYFEPSFFSGFTFDKERRSYLYKTFGYYISQDIKETSLTYLYVLYIFLVRNLRYTLKIFENIYLTSAEAFRDNSAFNDSFSEYIDNNSRRFSEDLTRFILAYTYRITSPSGSFLKGLVDRVEEKLLELKTIFKEAIKIRDSVMTNLVQYGSTILYNYLAAKITNSAADPSLGLVNQELIESLKKYELEINQSVLNKYSIQKFREYLFLTYYYKLIPRKFLNVLQFNIINYVRQHMIDLEENLFNFSNVQANFYKLLGTINVPTKTGINFSVLEELLKSVITPDFINESIEQQKIAEFSTRLQMMTYLEDIFKLNDSNDFSVFVDDLYSLIFDYLKNTVQVDPYYEHFFNRKMLFWYLLAYLKRDTLQNKIFFKNEIQLSEIFYDLVNSPEYSVNINVEKMRSRTVQYLEGNITNIGNLFENILETATEKKLHSENITYFLN